MRRLGRVALWIGGMVGLAVLVAVLLPFSRLDAAAEFLAQWRGSLAVARVAAIAALWWWWEAFALWIGRSEEIVEYLRERRNFYTGCLVGVELLIVQNVALGVWELVVG